jgi:tetratricopeptide (TPR) repeat protein
MNSNLTTALYNYLMDPKNPIYNFTLGKVYEDMGHTAAAASFYIRCSEFSVEHQENDLLGYEALLRLALCFQRQGSRIFTTKGILLRAISLLPERPEAYYLLSRMYEINKDWQESYTFAILGENLKDKSPKKKLITDVEYPGEYGLTFERAVTAWWLGLWNESIHLFKQLLKNPNMLWQFTQISQNNLNNLGGKVWKEPIVYWNSQYEHLKVKFSDSDLIDRNYSQCYQDMFVLTMLNGKRDGKFLEIGSADPYYGNNTALLEKMFEWTGISIDINQDLINIFADARISKPICADTTKINYEEILDEGDYDYLQLDCDPPIITYNTLLKIPFHKHRFAVITFEHDHYADEKADIRNKSRKYLESLGYEMVVSNIAPDNYNSYEDWWVHPELVDKDIIEKMKDLSDKPKRADKYMLDRI